MNGAPGGDLLAAYAGAGESWRGYGGGSDSGEGPGEVWGATGAEAGGAGVLNGWCLSAAGREVGAGEIGPERTILDHKPETSHGGFADLPKLLYLTVTESKRP